MEETKAETLRHIITKFRKELEKATLEKGLAAEDNKDLRENFAYDYWDDKERMITIRIGKVLKELSDLTKAKVQKPVKKKPLKQTEKISFQPHKWI